MARPAPLLIQISTHGETSLCLSDGESVIGSDYESDLRDCSRSGDCLPACEYVRDQIGVAFHIVARNGAGEYENRPATPEEMQQCAESIYFESDSDFSDIDTAATYLIWDACQGEFNQ